MRLCRIGPEAAPGPPSTSKPMSSPWPRPPSPTARPAERPSASRPRTTSYPCSPTTACSEIEAWLARTPNPPGAIPIAQAELLVPVPKPNKIFCLAGNYAEHIKEGGGTPAERAQTFPYVFMKPPSTTLTHPNRPVVIPKAAPDGVDWELELAVIIGREVQERVRGRRPQVRRRLHDHQRHVAAPLPAKPGPQEAREGRLLRLAARQVVRHVLPVRPVRHVGGRRPRPAEPDDSSSASTAR